MAGIRVPWRTLLVLCGPAASGKSTFAAQRFAETYIVSSDRCREMICDDAGNQRVHRDTFDLFYYILNKRMFLQRFTVADSTALYVEARRSLLNLAQRHAYHTCLLLFNIAPEICRERNQGRERQVEEAVFAYHGRLLQQTLLEAPREGWSQLCVLGADDMDRDIEIEQE